MEHGEIYLVNVGFCIVYILSRWIQLQYGGKHYSNLKAFQVNQPNCILKNMSIEGANYVKKTPKLFSKIE
jgi:hypothetical protein